MQLRIQGSIIGLLVGDALGYEFEKRNHKTANRSTFDQLAAQNYTDVGAMTLCTMSSMNEMGEIDAQDIAYSINEWYIGGFLSSSFSNNKTTISQAVRKFGNGMPSDRCGSVDPSCDDSALIRMLPIAIITSKSSTQTTVKWAHSITNFTNRQPIVKVISALYCLILQNLLLQKREGAVQLLHDCYEAQGKENYLTALENIKQSKNKDLQGTTKAVDSFWSAWQAYSQNEDSFEESIRAALQFGGNANAIAAIAGSFSGACLGSRVVHRKWIKQLDLSSKIKGIIKAFVKNISNFSLTLDTHSAIM